MDLKKLSNFLLYLTLTEALVLQRLEPGTHGTKEDTTSDTSLNINEERLENITDVFDGVYTECILSLSYACLQKRTLLYLRNLNELSEIPVIGNYVKFVKLNDTERQDSYVDVTTGKSTEELSYQIDRAVDKFFNNHILKLNALGKNVTLPKNVEEFVGRKKKGGDDGGKTKKMMMMAMMCMKMKMAVMLPAMMGMMGMMSFKGMMFSMMSFMMTKMMLLMKILEKKGGGGHGGDGGWSSGGGGGAWMPAGSDYGSSGGYDSNGQWQSRSYLDVQSEATKMTPETNPPMIAYVKRQNKNAEINKPYSTIKLMNDEVLRLNQASKRSKRDVNGLKFEDNEMDITTETLIDNTANPQVKLHEIPKLKKIKISNAAFEKNIDNILENESHQQPIDQKTKSRDKRDVIDILRNAYYYLVNRFLGVTASNRKYQPPLYPRPNLQGIKYVYVPFKYIPKPRVPKEITNNPTQIMESGFKPIIQTVKPSSTGFDPIVATEDFNKGEIVEGPVETSRSYTDDFNKGAIPVASSRSFKKKIKYFKDTVNEAIEDNPWE